MISTKATADLEKTKRRRGEKGDNQIRYIFFLCVYLQKQNHCSHNIKEFKKNKRKKNKIMYVKKIRKQKTNRKMSRKQHSSRIKVKKNVFCLCFNGHVFLSYIDKNLPHLWLHFSGYGVHGE
mmetsp:Transcript_8395/g.14279  ORF Transcript_8395/g.14279 Transcript_8395/m.14279 type:complete len:122 (+) Transcript_8395:236-601(+)